MSQTHHFVLGTAGHIDHGKTALLRVLTGVDTDRLPEEKLRGITIDLGFAALELGNHRLAIVDAPGHERFVRNMLAGATGLDHALLVVAADDSVMPQTREHFEILKLLSLDAGVVAITKCDLVTDDWLSMVRDEVRSLVSGSFLEDAPVIATSATTNRGIEELKAALAKLCDAARPRRESGQFRMAIDRSFSLAGHGTVVTGTVASGKAFVGETLELWPGPRPVRVRTFHQHGLPVEFASRGCRAAVNLVGVHHSEIKRGDTLAAAGYLTPSQRLSVEVKPTSDGARPLRERARYKIYLGTAEVAGRLTFLSDLDGDRTGTRLAQLILAEPVFAVHGQPFVIREESPPATVGGGRVLDPCARRLRKKDQALIQRLDQLRSTDTSEVVAAAVEALGLTDWTPACVSRNTGVPTQELPQFFEAMAASGTLLELPVGPRRTIKVHRGVVDALETRLLATLRRLHAATPRLSTIPRPRLLTAMADVENEPLLQTLIQRLVDRKLLTSDAKRVSLRGYEPRLSQSEKKIKSEIAAAFKGTAFMPPDLETWSQGKGQKGSTIIDLFTLLCDEEVLEHVGGDLYLEAPAAVELRSKVAERLAGGATMSMADLRDLLGTTRKFAVPIGEYLDRIGLTVREADVRRLKPSNPIPEASS